MHLALIADEYPPGPHGGVGSFTADLAEGMASAGHRVTVYVVEAGRRYWSCGLEDKMEGNPRVNGVHLSSPGWMRWRPGGLWQRWKLLQYLKSEYRRNPFDILECMDNGGLLPFGGLSSAPTVVRLHGASFFFDKLLHSNTTDPFTHWCERRTLASADRLVAVSNYIGKAEPMLAGLDREADCTIYNSVDMKMFSPGPAQEIERGLIVFANSIHPRKGVAELCRAMNIIRKELPDARLVIVGKDMTKDASGRPYSEEVAEELDDETRARVTFTGRLKYRSEVLAYLRRASVCCYPSKLEGFGIAPVEAMALGKPVIYSRSGPGPEVIEDGFSGLLCDPEDPGDIAEKIGRVLRDASLAKSLGIAARERVAAMFDRPGWISKNISFYETLLA